MKLQVLCLKKELTELGYVAYDSIEKYRPTSMGLADIRLVLSGYSSDWNVDYYQNDKTIMIYSDDLIKDMLEIDTKTVEGKAFEKRYAEYQIKRWDDIPQVEIANEDWIKVKEKWSQIKIEKPEYVVMYLDSSGPLDKVEIKFKDKLSDEDVELMIKSHKDALKYYKARDLYIKNHPDYSEVWRGPQDDEYEADIMKYYDNDE